MRVEKKKYWPVPQALSISFYIGQFDCPDQLKALGDLLVLFSVFLYQPKYFLSQCSGSFSPLQVSRTSKKSWIKVNRERAR